MNRIATLTTALSFLILSAGAACAADLELVGFFLWQNTLAKATLDVMASPRH